MRLGADTNARPALAASEPAPAGSPQGVEARAFAVSDRDATLGEKPAGGVAYSLELKVRQAPAAVSLVQPASPQANRTRADAALDVGTTTEHAL